jgi:hypothetical protein
MIQNVINQIGGVGVYGAISICLFFGVFGGALIWAFLQKRSFLNRMGTMPLDESETKELKPARAPQERSITYHNVQAKVWTANRVSWQAKAWTINHRALHAQTWTTNHHE